MNNYPHLQNKNLQKSLAGVVVYSANIIVPLSANKREYKLEERSPIERNWLVGLWVTEEGKEVTETQTNATGSEFDSIYLALRVEESEIVEKVYAHQIQKANDNGHPFYLLLPGRINLSESSVYVNDNDNIAANTVFEFQAEYVKPAKQLR